MRLGRRPWCGGGVRPGPARGLRRYRADALPSEHTLTFENVYTPDGRVHTIVTPSPTRSCRGARGAGAGCAPHRAAGPAGRAGPPGRPPRLAARRGAPGLDAPLGCAVAGVAPARGLRRRGVAPCRRAGDQHRGCKPQRQPGSLLCRNGPNGGVDPGPSMAPIFTTRARSRIYAPARPSRSIPPARATPSRPRSDRFQRTGDPVRACFANVAASFVVEGLSYSTTPTRAQVGAHLAEQHGW